MVVKRVFREQICHKMNDIAIAEASIYTLMFTPEEIREFRKDLEKLPLDVSDATKTIVKGLDALFKVGEKNVIPSNKEADGE